MDLLYHSHTKMTNKKAPPDKRNGASKQYYLMSLFKLFPAVKPGVVVDGI
jgi:hypothetical protein